MFRRNRAGRALLPGGLPCPPEPGSGGAIGLEKAPIPVPPRENAKAIEAELRAAPAQAAPGMKRLKAHTPEWRPAIETLVYFFFIVRYTR
jgi:hypothetical protein